MSWNKLEISVPNINIDPLTGIIDSMKDLLNTLVGILETILNFAAAFTDPFAAALKLLINKLKGIVEQYLEDLGAYCLFIPVRKQLKTDFLGLGDITPSWAGELGLFGDPSSPLSPLDPDLNQFLTNANRYNGGNVGFFKTILESLYDEGDTNRPQFFNDNDYVGGFVIVMGSQFDPLGFLDDIWKLAGLFESPDLTPKVPRPTGLNAQAIQGISNGTFSTFLTWDLPDTPVWTLADLGGTVLIPDRYAIIRGKNTTRSLGAKSVIDLMGSRTFGEGDTASNGDIEVIKEDSYDITIGSYVDEDIPSEADDTFYYAVAWKLKALKNNEANTEGAGQILDYWYLSNVARVTPYPTLPASTPPDWYRTPSIASIFPEFATLLRKLLAQIESFSAKLLGAADMLKDYVEFLKAEISRYEKMVSEVLDTVKKLQEKFQLPSAGIYIRTFKGKGGNDFFISDLASSFLPQETTRPPFTRGDEYVAGAVIMTGGPEAAVSSLIDGLSWVFGGSPNVTDDSLTEIDLAINAIESAEFGSDMRPIATGTATESIVTSFNVAMEPIMAAPEETTQFGKDMKVL